jgi:hypothetical protein
MESIIVVRCGDVEGIVPLPIDRRSFPIIPLHADRDWGCPAASAADPRSSAPRFPIHPRVSYRCVLPLSSSLAPQWPLSRHLFDRFLKKVRSGSGHRSTHSGKPTVTRSQPCIEVGSHYEISLELRFQCAQWHRTGTDRRGPDPANRVGTRAIVDRIARAGRRHAGRLAVLEQTEARPSGSDSLGHLTPIAAVSA